MTETENKNPERETNEEKGMRSGRNSRIRGGIRALVVVYLGYLIYALNDGLRREEPGMGKTAVTAFSVVFAAAIVVILVMTFLQWKREQNPRPGGKAKTTERKETGMAEYCLTGSESDSKEDEP